LGTVLQFKKRQEVVLPPRLEITKLEFLGVIVTIIVTGLLSAYIKFYTPLV